MGYLTGRVAIVTGAAKGIGRASAILFAAEGAAVVVNYRHSRAEAESVVSLIESTGGRAMAIQADVASKDQVQQMVHRVTEAWGDVHILMNNAGIALDGPADSMSEEDFDAVVDVSLKGSFLCSQAVIASMRRAGGGKIINVSAASALRGRKNGVNFCASRAGVIALTKCLAREWAPDIQVNCLMPGFTATEEVIGRFHLDDPAVRARLLEDTPLGRLAEPEEIADGALLLASKYSDQMTGQTLAVNGGSYMG